MSVDELRRAIESSLGDRLLALQTPSDRRLYLTVDPHVIADTARLMYRDRKARLQTASAVDAPQKIEILYHWALDALALVITVRTHLDRERPEIASITAICPAAHWIEREMWELMGITFLGHPDMQHLLLQDDWPAGKYPLRRDYRKE